MPVSLASNRTWLIVTTILFGLAGALGVVLGLFSFFLFDAPGSEKNPATILLFLSLITLSIVCFLSIALSWILHARKNFTTARCISVLPLLNIASGAGALIWLELFNHGMFS